MAMKYPGLNALESAFTIIKQALAGKQARLTGSPGQVVGFDDTGKARAVSIETDDNVEIVQRNGVLRARRAIDGVLQSIYIQTPPAKIVYLPGEVFDPAGMVVMGRYLLKDGGAADVRITGYAYPTAPLGTGTTQITISYFEGGAVCTAVVEVTVPLPDKKALHDTSWADIRKVADAGLASEYWAVGDTKTITLNGQVGNYTFSNFPIDVFILGFDHNGGIEGENRIDFQIGKIGGKDIALCNGERDTEQTLDGYFHMNPSFTNAGGWKDSVMRRTLLGSANAPTNPLANSLMAALPADVRAVMRPVTKYTDNTGGGINTADCVTATEDWLFLLSEFEVFGPSGNTNLAEQNYQLQYQYYKNGNSKVAYDHSANSTAVGWWLRSPHYASNNTFRTVSSKGGSGHSAAPWSEGVRPCFSV